MLTRFLLMAVTTGALSLIAVLLSLSSSTNHDEIQYISSSFFTKDLRIYQDFFYSQTPYFPMALELWNSAFRDVVTPYVAGRLFVSAWSCIFIATLVMLVFMPGNRLWVSILVVGATFSTTWLDQPMRMVRNDTMPLALATLALAAIVVAQYRPRPTVICLHFAAGVLVSLAVGAKQSYAFVAIAFVLYAVLAPHLPLRARITMLVLPLAAGGLVGSVPMLATVLPAWSNFAYSVSEYHTTAHALYLHGRPAADTGVIERFATLARILAEPSTLAFAVVAIALVANSGLSATTNFLLGRSPEASIVMICVATIGLVWASCLITFPLWPQYAAPSLPFMAVGLCTFGSSFDRRPALGTAPNSRWFAVGVCSAVAVLLVFGAARTDLGVVANAKRMLFQADETPSRHPYARVEDWLGKRLDPITQRLKDILGPPNADVQVATLMGALPIDAGYGLDRAFAGAPFFYQSNDYLDPSALERLRGTSPSSVDQYLSSVGAKILLTGYDADLEAGFRVYAVQNGLVCHLINLNGLYGATVGRLYTAPGVSAEPGDC